VSAVAACCGGGEKTTATTASPTTSVTASPSPTQAGADTCTTVHQIEEIDRKFNPLLLEFPKDPGEVQKTAEDLADVYVGLQTQMKDIPTLIGDPKVTEGRMLLSQSLDLAVKGMSDLASSIRTSDANLFAQAQGELDQMESLYRQHLPDVLVTACR